MKPVAIFITAVLLWVHVQRSLDSDNPCSVFSQSGVCSSAIEE
jgi:hypothetical protein